MKKIWKFPLFQLNSFFHTFPFLDTFSLLGLGYFWPHFSNKVSPKQTCPTLSYKPCFVDVYADVTLACDDDHQIQAPKNTLFTEFVVIDLGIILEDLASSICSDDSQIKGQKTRILIPFSKRNPKRLMDYGFLLVVNFVQICQAWT